MIAPNISIIIPVFNVQETLKKCLDSIFTQSSKISFEVIAVDDCSTDKSYEILKQYRSNEPSLKIIQHKTNLKLSKARLTGMQASVGNFIMHLDSDDYLLPGSLNKLQKICKKSTADIIVYNYFRKDKQNQLIEEGQIIFEEISSEKLRFQKHFLSTCWNKIVKRELLNDLVYGTRGINMSEDMIYATEIFIKSRKIHIVPDRLYVYKSNEDSITATIVPKDFIEQQQVILEQIRLIIKKYKPSQVIIANLMKYWESFFFLFIAKTLFFEKKNIYLRPELIELLKELTIVNHKIILLSTSSKLLSILMVYLKLGLLPVVKILVSGFRKKATNTKN